MSYDLFFYSRPNNAQLTHTLFHEYFEGRAHFQISGSVAFYENEDTGVYFSFDCDEPKIEYAELSSENPVCASFNINFFRPHVFAVEAAPVLEAFIRHFDLLVEDPHEQMPETGEYSKQGFFEGWDYGNRCAYDSLFNKYSDKGYGNTIENALPKNEIHRIWKWNFYRQELQNTLGDIVFVPRIMYLKRHNRINTVVVWSDAIPTVFPVVDYVLLFRNQLAPRSLFPKKQDHAIITFNDIPGIETTKSEEYHGGAGYPPQYEIPSKSLTLFFKAQHTCNEDLEVMKTESVLNLEIIEDVINK